MHTQSHVCTSTVTASSLHSLWMLIRVSCPFKNVRVYFKATFVGETSFYTRTVSKLLLQSSDYKLHAVTSHTRGKVRRKGVKCKMRIKVELGNKDDEDIRINNPQKF